MARGASSMTPIYAAPAAGEAWIDGQKRAFEEGEMLPFPVAWLGKARPIKYTTRCYGRHPKG